MTNEELEEIRERTTEATPAPWRVNEIAGYTVDQIHACSADEPFSNQNYVATAEGSNYSKDAIFIAHARTDIPALLDHIRLLETMRLNELHYIEKVFVNLRSHGLHEDGKEYVYDTLGWLRNRIADKKRDYKEDKDKKWLSTVK